MAFDVSNECDGIAVAPFLLLPCAGLVRCMHLDLPAYTMVWTSSCLPKVHSSPSTFHGDLGCVLYTAMGN